MRFIKYLSIIVLYFLSLQNLFGQDEKKYITIVPGEQFKSGAVKEFFMGSHWRDVWAVPIKVEVLDLNKFAGGLTPIKRGGGFQTKSLRLKGNDNKIWKFRSMDKDPSKTLPVLLRRTIAADVLKDQISSAHPFAAMVAAGILDSVGIIHNRPYLVYMPDDSKLGKYQEEFGGLLGMLEVHPDVDEEEGLEYRGAEKISSTFKLFDRIAEERDEFINSKEYLKARLVDVFMGDWDRHTDQWKWARYEIDGKKLWHPIPRDRDQPFAKFDGLLVRAAEYMIPQFVHFDEDYPQVEDITWSGRFIDRRFLTELTKAEWDSVTGFVKEKLTDNVIKSAVKNLPPEVYELSKEELENNLILRRDNLAEISAEYYELINYVVDIYASNKDDIVFVNRVDDNFTEVKLFNRGKKSKTAKGKIRYYKIFDNSLTDELRIFLLDGDDRIEITGTVNSGPLIRAIGGDGKDELVDESEVEGYWLDFTPISNAENKTKFYDSGKKTKIKFGPGSKYYDAKVKKPEDFFEKYEPQQRNRSHDWMPNIVLGLNPDDGFVFGGGPMLTKYNFRSVPYDYFVTATAQYATGVEHGAADFTGVFNSFIPGASFVLNAEWTGLAFTKFYGFGNQTSFSTEREDNDYYRVNHSFFNLSSLLVFGLDKRNQFAFGVTYDYSDLSIDNIELLDNSPQGIYGLGRLSALELISQYIYDSRDNKLNAYKGFYLDLFASYTPEVFDSNSDFLFTAFDARKYFTFRNFTTMTLALRAGGSKVWGDFPFLAGSFLGGKENLRGYSRERFSGNAALFGQSELRIRLKEIMLVLPGYLGITGFAETGRVFAEGLKSDKWHPSYGGGIWIDYLEKMATITLNIAASEEKTAFYITLGMMF